MAGDSRGPVTSTTGEREDSWPDLKALFDSAILLPIDERGSYIQRQCGQNELLRLELESLLLEYEQTGEFLEQPIASLQPLLRQSPGVNQDAIDLSQTEVQAVAAVGERIGVYRLEREIGQGGMGAVFLAARADGEFDQQVAIKLIRRGLESDFAVRRFRHERQIVATLEHPYIGRLLDGGSTKEGLPYFVMEYVEGRQITHFCDEEKLDAQGRIQIFLRVCSAVQYAHERNIIHRDLKPGNILINAAGRPKLLDFGIAKMMGADSSANKADATAAGSRILTPAYASPEQLRGDTASVRSDVYSLGVILHELLWGERPGRSTLRHESRRAGDSPDADPSRQSPPELLRIVFQAIHWDSGDRYSSVQELTEDLKHYLEGAAPKTSTRTSFATDTTASSVSIAILPLRFAHEAGEETAFLATGIADALISRLSAVERLSVRPTSASSKYAGDLDTARAARQLNVKYILEGSVRAVHKNIRVSLQLVHADASITAWAAQFDRPADNLLQLEKSIAEEVASALLPRLTSEERAQIGRNGTSNSKAHESYLRGRWHWGRSTGDLEELTKALLCFSQAIAEDPKYALAHAGLADYYLRLGIWGRLPPKDSFAAAMESAERAVQLDPAAGEAHASLGFASWAYRRDYRAAEQHFNLAIIRNPDYGCAHHWFGLLNSARNQPDLAVANLERGHQLEPHSAVIVAALGFVYYNARQYERAIELLSRAARELRDSAVVQEMLAWCHLKTADTTKAIECSQLAVALSGRSPASLSVLGNALAASGDRGGTAALCGELEEIGRQRYVSGYDRASAYLAAGEPRKAIASLEQALQEGDWWISWLGVEPRWDALRSDPRFRKLAVAVQQPMIEAGPAGTASVPKRSRAFSVTASLLLSAAITIAAFLFWRSIATRDARFENVRTTKITGNGIANAAAISPDGKFSAYTTTEKGVTTLLMRELSSGRTQQVAPNIKGNISALGFTSNGEAISFVSYSSEQPLEQNLFHVALSGGEPRKLLGPFSGGGAMSVNGRFATTFEGSGKTDQMWIHDLKAGTRRQIKSYRYPERFAWVCIPAWSPDGRTIAYAAEQHDAEGFLVRLYSMDVATGRAVLVKSPRFNLVQDIAWMGDGAGLAMVGQERDSPFRQIWYLPLHGGDIRRIGNDLDNYSTASITSDSSEIVSIQVKTESNIYTASYGDLAHPMQVTPGSGRYFDLSWTPDGKILYASDATGSADLWIMNADGSAPQQIVSGLGRSYAPVMSPDSRNIVFHSNRSGNWQIWCVDANGNHPKQLSQSSRDANWPQFTTDSRFAVYHQTDLNGAYNLWRVPILGGEPARLTTALTMHPAVSPHDGQIAAWWSNTIENPHWKIATFSPSGGDPQRIFTPAAAAYPDTALSWTPSGNAITYLDHAKGAANIWRQPLDGAPLRQLTDFTSGDIYSFDWSKDNQLLYSRGLTTSDVVLIRDAGARKR